MKFGKLGVFTFTDAMTAKELGELASRLDALNYSTLWYPEAFNYEPFALGGYLLNHSTKLIVASGIANIYARDAAAAAMGHNSLNTFYGGRFVLGLGVSHAPFVSDLRGHQYTQPLATMRDYLDRMDQAWTAMNNTPSAKQLVLAALGPKMSKLAAERTLGSFPYNITPDQVALSRAVMGPAAAVICEQKVCVCSDPVAARKAARSALGLYLSLPNYYQNWFRLGFDESDLKNGGSDRLIDAMVYWGDAEQIKSKLRVYFERGADQVVIQPIRADGKPGPDWAALEALASLA